MKKFVKRMDLTTKAKEIADLSQEFSLSENTISILLARGIEKKDEISEFLNLRKEDLKDPFALHGMKEAVARITEAVEKGERVLLYGDYDVDGLTGIAMLSKFFKKKSIEFYPYVPQREDGYGLKIENIYQLLEDFNPDLVITCDLGISAKEETEELLDLGIDVIITDHHIPPQELPQTTIVNPKLQENATDFSGAGVVFKLMQALGENIDDYIELCAISTVGDSVELLKENRVIVRLGLEKINENPSPFVKALKEVSQIKGKVTTENIGFSIAPRINAAGRMGDVSKVLEFLLEEDTELLKERANLLNEINKERQDLCDFAISLARKKFQTSSDKSVIIVEDDQIPLGLLGIVASKLTEEFSRPAIVLTKSRGVLKGSVRSVDGINIHGELSKFANYFTSFGGHAMACGLSLFEEDLPLFKKEFEDHLATFAPSDFAKNLKYDLNLDDVSLSLDFLHELESLEPFGIRNPRPTFYKKTKSVDVRLMGQDGKHLQGSLDGVKLIAFSMARERKALIGNSEKGLLLTIINDNYMSHDKVGLLLRDLILYEPPFFPKAMESLYPFDNEKNSSFAELEERIKISPFGTLILVSSLAGIKSLMASPVTKNLTIATKELPRGNFNTILVAPTSCAGFEFYQSIFILDSFSFPGATCPKKIGLLPFEKSDSMEIEREEFVEIFKEISKAQHMGLSSFFALQSYISNLVKIAPNKLYFVFNVLRELGIIKIENKTIQIDNSEKKDLNDSILFNMWR